MAPPSLWALSALLPLLSTANGLVFELSPHAHKRQPQHHRLAQKAKRAAPVLPATWAYLNCYTDGPSRALSAGGFDSNTMTIEACVDYCNNAGYVYAGLEYSAQCFCDNAINNGFTVATDGRCNMMCAGDATQVCGGPYGLSVYQSTKPLPAPLVSYNNWGYQGCYTDSIDARTLTYPLAVNAPFTPQECLDACHAQNYAYAGVEYADECYCGNALSNGGVAASDATTCDMTCAGNTQLICGGPDRLSLYQYGVAPISGATTTTTGATTTTTSTTSTTTAPTTTPTGPSTLASYNGWASVGCYVDSVAARTIPNGMAVPGGAAAMTVQLCLTACQNAGYTVAGLEYSEECYCSDALPPQVATDGRCDMVCNGNPLEYCGGPNGLDVYQLGATPPTTTTTTTSTTSTTTGSTTTPTGPSTLASYNGWTEVGCYVDSVAARTLPYGAATPGGGAAMTVELCLTTCKNDGYSFAGLEYSQQCFCGNALPPQVATDGRCDMVCAGNPLEYCGGPNGLTVYQYGTAPPPTTTTTTTSSTSTTTTTGPTTTPTGPSTLQASGNWTLAGCYVDSVAARTLPYGAATPGGGAALTVELCLTACLSAGYGFAGVEYSQQCYCGSALPPQVATDGRCDMVCSGNALEYCGGPNGLTTYKYNGVVPPPTTPPNNGGGGGGGGGGNPGTGLGPVTTGLPTPWAYVGCYVDNAYGRILSTGVAGSTDNTPATCIAACVALGFDLAGMEYTDECYCGNAIINDGVKAAADTDCGMPCSGDANHACGGPNRVSLYSSVTTFPSYPVPSALTTGLPGKYVYTACYHEPGNGQPQTFLYMLYDDVNTTVQGCLTQCSTYGYDGAALEYGSQCWCGDVDTLASRGAYLGAETDCNIPCTGAPATLCGGVGTFNLYTWPSSPDPLVLFHTPSNTGSYEFLIGGLVIPLIATLGINDKVTFLEKWGTGPPNTTGAYELDYSLVDDYTKAWRTMHVSSDVFCAANLVLPDKAGRVLSIGGWSLSSTQGIRLYTPSGSPGVNGTTDWEEFWDEIHLQQGRWYPGALQMANGSVLIIGGEEGSNGAPVPSVEILPAPEGGPTYLEMDWLLESDPNNLYPFSFVLPHGNIFVIYFNQAIIIDEVTFATIKNFPTIPGQVNAVGGRTYPMEGTAMVLPQYAPYTDPLEILTCGGSAFGQAFDNCVTIQPEVEGAQWVIERMPSRRVMTLMTGLPDGTFFIGGGAEAGVAGFGLANTPNLGALLYDPTQPTNQRVSILSTTIVARLYHSEAILLHDGRILISGSDPEDGVNPQEYRVEVYIPPYRSDGSTPPTFTLTETDWTYGANYTFTYNTHSGNKPRVSLLGGVSTTHGNNFGQRTFFPSMTCAGNSCQVTAPPNAHVCPPGWHQMFILDGPTPSFGQWVRIGGDPASLGNWPNYPGFTLPGV